MSSLDVSTCLDTTLENSRKNAAETPPGAFGGLLARPLWISIGLCMVCVRGTEVTM